jgi:hypothetical protein
LPASCCKSPIAVSKPIACTERDLVAFEPGRITLAIPSLVVAQNERYHRIGKWHTADNLGTHPRVDADLLEFLQCQGTWLG